jgi:MFS family permease
MDSSIFFSLVLPVLIALAVASRGFRVDQEYVARWASSAGLELTEETRPVVRRYLTWSRRARTVGGLVGFLAPVIYAQIGEVALRHEVITESEAGGWSVLLMFIGYLLGALVADFVINRPGRRGSMLPGSRRLGEYLSHYLLIIQRSLGITCAALVGAYVLLSPLADRPRPSLGSVAVYGLVGVGVAAAIEALQRTIIGRRHAATSENELAVDDAMRSSSVHLVAGAGIAVLIFFAALLLSALLFLVETAAGVASFALMLFLFPLSIFFWLDSGKPHGFRVRRDRFSTPQMKGETS